MIGRMSAVVIGRMWLFENHQVWVVRADMVVRAIG